MYPRMMLPVYHLQRPYVLLFDGGPVDGLVTRFDDWVVLVGRLHPCGSHAPFPGSLHSCLEEVADLSY